jgi:hypothetical protein
MRSGRATIQQRLGQELVRLAYVGLDTRTLRNETVSLLYQFLHVDAIWWALADPGTLLFSRALSHGVPPTAAPLFLENELLHDDLNKFATLARASDPTNTLLAATRSTGRHCGSRAREHHSVSGSLTGRR